ncbi:MAG: DUF4178 domain-containing protein [Deltaproteobacteria bacterium]|nr:DUF4178 domain-containing protein [Deltaproteobacteria bacterium]
MIWILLVLLTVVGGFAAVGIAVNERRKQVGGGSQPRQLPAGSGDKLLERTVRDVRVDDVLTMGQMDFLCEGLISYDEDGHRWTGARLVDNKDVHWLIVGMERVGSGTMRLMQADETQSIAGYPPEAIVIGEVRFVLDKRGAATCKLEGDVGPLGDLKKDRPSGHVERCRWWLYNAPGEDTLLVEQWGSDYRVLRGKKLAGEGTLELIPAS